MEKDENIIKSKEKLEELLHLWQSNLPVSTVNFAAELYLPKWFTWNKCTSRYIVATLLMGNPKKKRQTSSFKSMPTHQAWALIGYKKVCAYHLTQNITCDNRVYFFLLVHHGIIPGAPCYCRKFLQDFLIFGWKSVIVGYDKQSSFNDHIFRIMVWKVSTQKNTLHCTLYPAFRHWQWVIYTQTCVPKESITCLIGLSDYYNSKYKWHQLNGSNHVRDFFLTNCETSYDMALHSKPHKTALKAELCSQCG